MSTDIKEQSFFDVFILAWKQRGERETLIFKHFNEVA